MLNSSNQQTRIYSEDNNISFIKEINIPTTLHPGQEKIIDALVLNAHNNILRVSFLWSDKSVKIIGPYMVNENVFEFPPSKEACRWFLKIGVDNGVSINCDKQVYVIIEEIRERKCVKILLNVILYVLIILSFLPLILSYIKDFNNPTFVALSIGGAISIPIPIITIMSMILMSNKISIAIQRLSNIKIVRDVFYREKAFTGKINIRKISLQEGN
jgi:hypothetical protein